MKKLKFQWNISIIILFVICFLFTGCSSHDKSYDENILNKKLDEVTLKFYFSFVPQTQEQPKIQNVVDEIEKLTKDTLNIKLNFEWLPADSYENKLKQLLASGDTFDAFIANATFSDWAQELIKDNILLEDYLLDITQLFPQYAPALYRSFTNEEHLEASYKGKIMAIPHHMTGSRRMCAVVREDLMKKYYIPEIKTFEDYERYMKIVKDNEKGVLPAVSPNYYEVDLFSGSYGYVNFGNFIVYKWNDKSMKLVSWEQTPEFKDSIETLKRWHQNGLIVNLSGGYVTPMQNGSASSTITTWDTSQYFLRSAWYAGKLCVYPLYTDKIAEKTPITSSSVIINKHARNPERTIMFLEWIESCQQNYDLFIYGINDENYTLNDKQRIVFPEGNKKIFGWPGSEAFLNIDYMRAGLSDQDDYKEQYKRNVELNTEYRLDTGFIPNWEAVQVSINDRVRNFNNLERNIRNGVFDFNVNDFIKEQKDAGIDRVIDVMQKQLDDWAKKKSSMNELILLAQSIHSAPK